MSNGACEPNDIAYWYPTSIKSIPLLYFSILSGKIKINLTKNPNKIKRNQTLYWLRIKLILRFLLVRTKSGKIINVNNFSTDLNPPKIVSLLKKNLKENKKWKKI